MPSEATGTAVRRLFLSTLAEILSADWEFVSGIKILGKDFEVI